MVGAHLKKKMHLQLERGKADGVNVNVYLAKRVDYQEMKILDNAKEEAAYKSCVTFLK